MRSEREDKQAQNTVRRAKIMNVFVLRLSLRVQLAKTRRPPKLSPMADDTITWGGLGDLGSVGKTELYMVLCNCKQLVSKTFCN